MEKIIVGSNADTHDRSRFSKEEMRGIEIQNPLHMIPMGSSEDTHVREEMQVIQIENPLHTIPSMIPKPRPSNHVVLINPDFNTTDWTPKPIGTRSSGVPMGLLSLGSVLLEKGYRVTILDGVLGKIHLGEELTKLDPQDVLFVGLSTMTSQLPSAIKAADLVRRRFPTIPLIWGGAHPTLFPEQTCVDPEVDVVVIGEGEDTVIEVAEAFQGKRDLSNIKGIVFKGEDGNTHFTGVRTPPDLNCLPAPRYEDLFDIEDYILRPRPVHGEPGKVRLTRTLDLHTGMGCPHRCTFCIDTVLYRPGKYYERSMYRGKTGQRTLDEIQMLIDKFGVEHVDFVDENFFVDKHRLFEYLDQIEARQMRFTWFASCRANYFNEGFVTEKVVAQMFRAGCLMIGTGGESGSERMLRFMKKDILVPQIINEAKLLSKYKILSEFSFIVGLPTETADEMLETIDLVKELRRIGPFVGAQTPQLYRPLPGGELFDECIKYGLEAPKGIRDWTTERLEGRPGSLAVAGSGGSGVDELSWVPKDSKTVQVIRYTLKVLFVGKSRWWLSDRSMTTAITTLLIAALKGLFRIRRKFDIWGCPVEWKIFGFFRFVRRSGNLLIQKLKHRSSKPNPVSAANVPAGVCAR